MRKHFLILMLMAFLPLASFAALDIKLKEGTQKAAQLERVYKGEAYAIEVYDGETLLNGDNPAEGYTISWTRTGFTEYGVYSCIVTKTGEADPGSATLTITKAPLEVKAKPVQDVYSGTPKNVWDLYETVGENTWKNANDQNLLKGSAVQILWLGHETQPTDAGAYNFTVAPSNLTNYNVTVTDGYESSVLNITKLPIKATVAITSPANKTLTYGEATLTNPAWTVTYQTLDATPKPVTATRLSEYFEVKTADATPVNFYATYEEDGITPKTVAGNAGEYTVTPFATFANYEVTTKVTDAFTINKKEITAEWIKLSKTSFTFNNDVQAPTAVVKDGEKTLTLTTDYTITIPTTSKNADTYEVSVLAAGKNYKTKNDAAVKATYTIEKAPLVLVIKNDDKTYDGIDLADVTIDNVNNIANYATVYNNIKNDNAVWQDANATTDGNQFITFHYVPNQIGVDPDSGDPLYTLSEAGDYVITATDFKAPNYDVQIQNGTFTIGGAEIQLIAADAEKTYGEADPAFTYWVKKGDAIIKTHLNDYIKTAPSSITREKADENKPGEYVITPSADAVATDNYVLKSEVGTGTFTIKKKSVTILANAGEKVYDGVEPKFNKETDFTVLTPLVGEDAVTSVTLYKEAGVDAGTYDVTPSNAQGISEDYYKINYMVGTYTITPRRLTKIQIANQTINLNQNETNLDKNKVTFTADNYTLTADDITKLKSEFDYDFTTATATDAEAGPFANRIRIKYHGTGAAAKFTNFSLPIQTGTTEIDLAATQTIADKYILGALTIKGNAGAAAVLFADDATVAEEKVASLINTYKGQKINVEVELNRSQALGTTNCNWAAEKWNTLCLPFDVTVRELSNQLGYAIVNVVDASKTTTGNVQFKLQMAGTIKANTPFVVKTDEAIADGKVLAFAGKTIEQGSASVDAGCGYEFVGVYDTKTLNKADSKLSFLRGNGEKWVFIGESSENTWNLVPMTAYIDLTPATNAHEVTFTMQEADGSTTVIRNISAETASKLNAEGWYTINGMKLNAAPTEKGIYINNGKKVVLK